MNLIKPMSLDAWLVLLENRHQHEIQLGLTRVKQVADRLGLCHLNTCVITVAGTNGKGSTVAALEAIYHVAGMRVGCYTSPHLLAFNERICVNQAPITDENLCAAFDVIEKARGEIDLTYFEMTTLAALYHFKWCALDVVILEVGMGGRLDATNIIDADLAIITTIDLDHEAYLGDTIEAIGYEKAGILKADQLFVYADYSPPASVLEQAHALNIYPICLGRDYAYHAAADRLSITSDAGLNIQLYRPGLHLNAAAAAIIASDLLRGVLPVTDLQWDKAMRMVGLTGRQQIIPGPVMTVLDVAHNPQAALLLAEFVRSFDRRGKVHAVFSGLKDKDLCGLIRPMVGCVDFWYLAILTGKRGSSETLLQSALQAETGTKAPCFSSPELAFHVAKQQANPGD
ncbi:MAG TPA: bifunctional tetrahydrofolate synthase/dihydrofolate synthase, partial [Legionella sp.]|nr:bifunctional tetrahydrofolate synthase/dihydrofolate synthase [Legionella sp.]